MNLVRHAQERSIAVFLLLLALAAGGVVAGLRLPSSIFPAVTFPLVKIIADVGEEPAARMIPAVTRPLEEAVSRVPGIRSVRSLTSRGSTEMSAELDWGTDMQVALQRVEAEVARVRPDLPPDTRVDVERMSTSIFPVLGYALTSDKLPQWQLWQHAEYVLKPELLRIPGVSSVQVQGGRQREIQVHLDLAALAGRHLTPNDVVDALGRNHQLLSAGLVERNHELYLALVDGRGGGVQGLEALAIPLPNGRPVRLGELGSVTAEDAVSYVRTTADGREAVLVNVVQQPTANTVAIEQGVRDLLDQHPELVPPGVAWSNFYDQAGFITDSVHGVRDAILIGVGLAALVLLVFLRQWRLTLDRGGLHPARRRPGHARPAHVRHDDQPDDPGGHRRGPRPGRRRHHRDGRERPSPPAGRPVTAAGGERHPRAAARPGRLEPVDHRRLRAVRAGLRRRRGVLQAARPDPRPRPRRLLLHRRLRRAGSPAALGRRHRGKRCARAPPAMRRGATRWRGRGGGG